MSSLKDMPLPILACPDCHQTLELTLERNLVCHGCSTEYQGHDGIAQLIGSKSKIPLINRLSWGITAKVTRIAE